MKDYYAGKSGVEIKTMTKEERLIAEQKARDDSIGPAPCYVNSKGRGWPKPISECAEDQEKNGLLCYPKCKKGFSGFVTRCYEKCPEGYPDHKTGFCGKPEGYSRKSYARESACTATEGVKCKYSY